MIALIIQCLTSLVDISASQTSLPQEMLNSIPYTVSHHGDETLNEESVRAVTPSSTSREPQVPLYHLSYLPAPKPSSPTGGIITDGVGYIYSNKKTITFDRTPVSTSLTPPQSSRSDEMGGGPGMLGPGLGLGSQIGTVTPSFGMGPVSKGISIGTQSTFSSSTIITTPTNVTLVSAKPPISNPLYSSAVPTGSLPPYNLITPQSRMMSSFPPPLSHMPLSVTLSSSLLTISTATSLTTSKPPVTISPESSIQSNAPVYTSSVTHSTTPISFIQSNTPVYSSSVTHSTTPISLTHSNAPVYSSSVTHSTSPISLIQSNAPVYSSSVTHSTTPISLTHSNAPVYTSSVTHSTTPISLIQSNAPVYSSSVTHSTTPISLTHSNAPVYSSSVTHSTTSISLTHSNAPVYSSNVTTPVSSIHSNVPFSVPHSNAPVSKGSTSTFKLPQFPFPGTQPSITKPPPTTLTNMSGIQSRLHGMQTQSSVAGNSLTEVPVSSSFVATQSSVTSTASLTYSVNTVPTKPSTTSKQDSISTVTSTIPSLSSSLTVPTMTKSFSFTTGANFSFGPGGGMRSSTTSGPFVFGGSTPNSTSPFTMFHTSAPLGHPPPPVSFPFSSPISSLSSSQGINTSTAQTIHKPVPTTTGK